MQIIILTSASNSSGGTRQALYLVKGFMEKGHDVLFFTPPGAALRAKGYDAPWADLPAKPSQWRAAIEAHMKKDTPCIVQAFHNKAVKVTSLAGFIWRLQKRPVVCFGYRGVIYSPRNPLPYLSPGMAGFIANSHASARVIRRMTLGLTPVHVVYNAIPEQRLAPNLAPETVKEQHAIAPDAFVIGSITGNGEVKGVQILLPAFAQALRENLIPAQSVLLLLGVCPEKWMPFCRELGIAHAVRMIEHSDLVADYLQCMDMYVLASLSESLPNALMEAMCMGLPAVGTTVGGVPELLCPSPDAARQKNPSKIGDAGSKEKSGALEMSPPEADKASDRDGIILPEGVEKTDGGLLVPPGNPAALANAMGTLSQSPELRRLMARNNMARRAQFDPRRRTEIVEALYIDALARRGILLSENK